MGLNSPAFLGTRKYTESNPLRMSCSLFLHQVLNLYKEEIYLLL